MTSIRIHWLKPDALSGTACGLGGLVSERTPDVTCRACIKLALAADRVVSWTLSRKTQTAVASGEARDPWQAVNPRKDF